MIEARSCSTICLSTGSELVDIERPRASLSPVSATLADLASFFLVERGLTEAEELAALGSRWACLRLRYSAMTLRMVRSVATVYTRSFWAGRWLWVGGDSDGIGSDSDQPSTDDKQTHIIAFNNNNHNNNDNN